MSAYSCFHSAQSLSVCIQLFAFCPVTQCLHTAFYILPSHSVSLYSCFHSAQSRYSTLFITAIYSVRGMPQSNFGMRHQPCGNSSNSNVLVHWLIIAEMSSFSIVFLLLHPNICFLTAFKWTVSQENKKLLNSITL